MVVFRGRWWQWQFRLAPQLGWKVTERNQFWDVIMIALGSLFMLIGILLLLNQWGIDHEYMIWQMWHQV